MQSAADGNGQNPTALPQPVARAKRTAFLVLLAVILGMMGYGAFLGNVFETYHNASTL